jgi:hypothetical protein
MVRAHREEMPEPDSSRQGAMCWSDLKLYPSRRVSAGTGSAATGWGKGKLWAQTSEGELGEHKQVQAIEIVWICSAEDVIGGAEIAVDIADLGVELQTGDPHGDDRVPERCNLPSSKQQPIQPKQRLLLDPGPSRSTPQS